MEIRRERKQHLKQKVLRDLAEHRANRKSVYKYDVVTHRRKKPPKKNPTKIYFRFPKSLIISLQWADLPLASKTVYPVIARHCNKQGKAWPSDKTIGVLCGRSEKTVRIGTQALAATLPNHFTITRTPKMKKVYVLDLPKKDSERKMFPFHLCLFDVDVWERLTPIAQALYPVMRCFAKVDVELYDYLEGTSFDDFPTGQSFDEYIETRIYDTIRADEVTKKTLAAYAGITRKSVNAALKNLEAEGLAQPFDGGWKVYLR